MKVRFTIQSLHVLEARIKTFENLISCEFCDFLNLLTKGFPFLINFYFLKDVIWLKRSSRKFSSKGGGWNARGCILTKIWQHFTCFAHPWPIQSKESSLCNMQPWGTPLGVVRLEKASPMHVSLRTFFIHFHSLSSTFINFHPHSSIFIHFH